MEDNIKKMKMEDTLNFFLKTTITKITKLRKWKTTSEKNGRRPQKNWKKTSKKIKDDLNFWTLEDDHNCFNMEDDLIFIEMEVKS
jgi:hypothetical protein